MPGPAARGPPGPMQRKKGAPVRGRRSLGPLVFEPILVAKPWGGRRLAALGKRPPPGGAAETRYGESWEVADMGAEALAGSEERRTRAAAGPHRGKTLRRLIAELGPALLGSSPPTPEGDFPLLVKVLDTAEHLSIQVHPDEDRAAVRPDWAAKTESWYVLEADPGAVIFKGFRPGVETGDAAAAAGTPALAGLMEQAPVRRGDFHHLPAGTIHALGAGVTVAEVQTPSDTTFRLYDWTEEYDRPRRPLHTADALQALSAEHPADASPPALEGGGKRLLINAPGYRIWEHRTESGQTLDIGEDPELRILMSAAGQAVVEAGAAPPQELGTGGALVIPADTAPFTAVTASGPAALLEIRLAQPRPSP